MLGTTRQVPISRVTGQVPYHYLICPVELTALIRRLDVDDNFMTQNLHLLDLYMC